MTAAAAGMMTTSAATWTTGTTSCAATRVMRSPAATGHTSTTGPMAWKGATATTAMIATAVAITLATTHGRDRDGRSDHFGHYREDRYSHEHKCSENPLSHLQWANLILSPG